MDIKVGTHLGNLLIEDLIIGIRDLFLFDIPWSSHLLFIRPLFILLFTILRVCQLDE